MDQQDKSGPKFTPGPWNYRRGKEGQPTLVQRGREGGFAVVGTSPEREEADAALIAAAPELFEALIAVLAGTSWADIEDAAFQKARAAIAKALGSQQ